MQLTWKCREVSIEHLQRVRHAKKGRLLFRTPGPVPYGICKCSFVETTDKQSYITPVYDTFPRHDVLPTLTLLRNIYTPSVFCNDEHKKNFDFDIHFAIKKHAWRMSRLLRRLFWIPPCCVFKTDIDDGSVPEMRIWSILLIKSDLKWCIHLSRSLFSYS